MLIIPTELDPNIQNKLRTGPQYGLSQHHRLPVLKHQQGLQSINLKSSDLLELGQLGMVELEHHFLFYTVCHRL